MNNNNVSIRYHDKVLLGIDPGIGIIGYGIYNVTNQFLYYYGHGTIRTHKLTHLSERLFLIHTEMQALLNSLPKDREVVVYLEKTFHSNNSKTVNNVNYAIGIILLTLRNFNYEFVYPTTIKKFFNLKGGQNKKQILQHMKLWFPILKNNNINYNDDAIDGLAIGMIGYYKYYYK